MDNFHDLQQSTQIDERMSHDFLIVLLDQLFGQHDHIRIDMDTESEQNHDIIKLQWKMIKQYYQLPSSVKNTQKLVRQTLMQIVIRVNQKYQFIHPLKFEHHRRAFRDKVTGKSTAENWIELTLI